MTPRLLRRSRTLTLATATILLSAACERTEEPDAYGNFEATEIVVSAETPGQLLRFDAIEGQALSNGTVVAVIDTTQLALERRQLATQRTATLARVASVSSQASALEVQRDQARREYERASSLFERGAIAQRQLEQAERDWRALAEQAEALHAQRRGASADVAGVDARVALLAERIAQSRIVNPIGGTVLATYADAGEFVQPGQPLYRIASLDTLVLRAYVGEPQLTSIRLGQTVTVRVDDGVEARRSLPGLVSWIASKAEFTPTSIQTRDARADLVYAVKIRVANPYGTLKIGMPADVSLAPQPSIAGAEGDR